GGADQLDDPCQELHEGAPGVVEKADDDPEDDRDAEAGGHERAEVGGVDPEGVAEDPSDLDLPRASRGLGGGGGGWCCCFHAAEPTRKEIAVQDGEAACGARFRRCR